MGGTRGVSALGWRLTGVVFLVVILAVVPAFAQTSQSILGTVKDASGAVVAGATITVHNTETDLTRTLSTGEDGGYRFAGLPVGHYDVTTEKGGFKNSTQRGIVLDVSQEVVINVSLVVGAANQTVEVTGEAPVVNTTSGTLGGLVNEEKMADLPLNGRNYLDLTLLQTGVSQDSVVLNLGGGTSGLIYSSNGAPINSNNFLLDGTPLQSIFGFNSASIAGATLGVDGIREYKVVTNAFSAEYGMSMGSQMTIVSKGGSNQFHGDVFDYLRNRVMDARNFFDTSQVDCLQSGGTTSTCPRSPVYQRNNFGGAFGGPIKKDKTFFWGVFEGLRQLKGNPIITKGPPEACVAAGTTAPYTVTSAECGGASVPFPNNAPITVPLNVRPLLALYDQADSIYTLKEPDAEYFGQMRVDQNFSSADSGFARYTIENSAEIVPPPGNGATPYGFREFQDNWQSRSQYITVGENHIFTPALLNSARLSFSRTSVPTNYISQDSTTGVNPSSCTAVAGGAPEGGTCTPGTDVSFIGGGQPMGIVAIGTGSGPGDSTYTSMGPDFPSPNYHLQNYWSLGDDIFYTRGKHALKFGVLLNRVQLIVGEIVFARGLIDYSNACAYNQVGGQTIDPTGLVCFLENQPATELAAIPGGVPRRHFRFETYGFYGQDDWRATKKLTLNLGLRYEFNTIPEETSGDQTFLADPESSSQVQAGPFTNNPSRKNFSPRVGFAYDPFGDGKTSIRGAFGVYYDISSIGMTMFGQVVGDPSTPNGTPPGRALNLCGGGPCINSGFYPGFILSSNDVGTFTPAASAPYFPNPGSTPTFAGYAPLPPLNLIDHTIQQPYMMQWNLTIDRQLPGNFGLSVSYVGTRGEHLWGVSDANPCQPTNVAGYTTPNWVNVGNLECPNGADDNTYNNVNSSTGPDTPCVMNSLGFGFPVTGDDGRHNCALSSDSQINTQSRSWYDALQVTLNKKLSHGLELQSAYTYSQSLDTAQGQIFIYGEPRTPGAPLNYDKGRSVVNAPQNWRFNALYHFPTWNADGFAPKLVNGWWMGNIISIQSGYAITPSAAGDPELNDLAGPSGIGGGAFEHPDYVTSANLAAALVSNPNAVVYNPKTVILHNPNEWFNVNMFTNSPLGVLGDVARGALTGPDLINWDFSMNKDTKLGFLGEAGNLQFRAEIFNILNHANFVNNPINGNGIVGQGAGALSVARDGRDIQLALKINF